MRQKKNCILFHHHHGFVVSQLKFVSSWATKINSTLPESLRHSMFNKHR